MKDATEIVIVMDRSGSMSSIREDMQGGFDSFVKEQRKIPGECRLSLYQFDDHYDMIYEGKRLDEVPACVLEPRGMTALLDAVGKTINSVGQRLSAIPETDRPNKVVFLVITDGHENISHEFKKSQIKEMVERQSKTYNWQFCYLGADLGAFDEGAGIAMTAAAYVPDAAGTRRLYDTIATSTTNYRTDNTATLVVNPKDLV